MQRHLETWKKVTAVEHVVITLRRLLQLAAFGVYLNDAPIRVGKQAM